MKKNVPSSKLTEHNLLGIKYALTEEETRKVWLILYNDIYIRMKNDENPFIILKNYYYQYLVELGNYCRYEENSEIIVNISREEVMNLLGNYLRRIKLEKICSKLETK